MCKPLSEKLVLKCMGKPMQLVDKGLKQGTYTASQGLGGPDDKIIDVRIFL